MKAPKIKRPVDYANELLALQMLEDAGTTNGLHIRTLRRNATNNLVRSINDAIADFFKGDENARPTADAKPVDAKPEVETLFDVETRQGKDGRIETVKVTLGRRGKSPAETETTRVNTYVTSEYRSITDVVDWIRADIVASPIGGAGIADAVVAAVEQHVREAGPLPVEPGHNVLVGISLDDHGVVDAEL